MAIGNLSSQIFANIYLNEFDRYVVHQLKPLGYIRYGDDTISWWRNEIEAEQSCVLARQFLANELSLELRHDFIQKTHRKLHVFGVYVWPNSITLDKRMRQRMARRPNINNLVSYQAIVRQRGVNSDLAYDLEDAIYPKGYVGGG